VRSVPRSSAGLLALVLCSLAVAGCSGTASIGGSPDASVGTSVPAVYGQAATSTVASAPVPAPVPSGSVAPGLKASAGPSAADLAAMKAQLDAMQKEIDALALPSDSDFSDAAGAVY